MARGEVTIAVHNGTEVATGHNIRDPEICKHEPHIDPNGIHEIWHHEDLRDFYARTFGAAQREYDNKARACRRIGDYLDSITRDAVAAEEANAEIKARNKEHKAAGEPMEKLKVAKKPVYEIIAGIYPQGDLELTERESRDALHLWLFGDGTDKHKSWEERNPGMKLVGAYYHADEPDARPHVHIDYVPVAECGRGMRVQNSLEGALNAQGLKSGKVKCEDGEERLKTAQEQFTDAERDGLQAICEEMGLEVVHPQRGKKSRHKSTAEKKRDTRTAEQEAALVDLDAMKAAVVADLERRKAEIEAELKATADALAEREKKLDGREKKLDGRGKELDEQEKSLTAWEAGLGDQEKALDEREKALGRKADALDEREKQLNGRELPLSSREDALKLREADVKKREDAAAARETSLDDVEKLALEARRKVENSPAYLDLWHENYKKQVQAGYEKMVQDGTYFEAYP